MSKLRKGWYDNPEGPGERYWDGTQWTGHRPSRKGPSFLGVFKGVVYAIVSLVVIVVLMFAACAEILS